MDETTLAARDPRQNQILAELPENTFRLLEPYLEQVSLPLGKVLYESGDTLRYVYFHWTASFRCSM